MKKREKNVSSLLSLFFVCPPSRDFHARSTICEENEGLVIAME